MWMVYLGVGLALAYALSLAVARRVYLAKHPLVPRTEQRSKVVVRVFLGIAFVLYAADGALLAADGSATFQDAVFLYVLTTLTLAYFYWITTGRSSRRRT